MNGAMQMIQILELLADKLKYYCGKPYPYLYFIVLICTFKLLIISYMLLTIRSILY